MKIFQISKADSFGGGASKVASELTTLLTERGYDVKHLVSWSGFGYDRNVKPLYGKHEKNIRRLHYFTKKIAFPEYVPFEYLELSKQLEKENPDIIHFHDLSSAISPLTLKFLSKKYKVVWTLHDCSPFTGGCLYPMSCEKYKESCGSCPQSGIWPIDSKIDTTRLGLTIKRNVHFKSNLHLISPSNWMADTAFESKNMPVRPFVLPNGVNEKIYHPDAKAKLKKTEIQNYEGLKVILSAGDLADYRKGIAHSVRALEKIKKYNPLVILVGNENSELDDKLKGFNRIYTGYISDPNIMAQYFSSADVFLFCSLADNMPLSILESLACGTPVIGYKTGGIVDMIKDDYNGYLVEQEDIDGLVKALKLSMSKNVLQRWKKSAREAVEEQYCYRKFVENHIDFYKEVLSK